MIRDARVVVGIALILLWAGAALPLWSMTLHAPQYPQGLRLTVAGGGLRGDLDELNALNHYIGMAEIREEAFPEARLLFPGLAAITLGALLTLVVRWRWLRWLTLAGAWALPVTVLADLQWRLYVFGHTLDPAAAFRLPPFTPRVIGPTVVMNFNVTAWPGIGLLLLLAGAAVLSLGPQPRGPRVAVRPVPAMAAGALAIAIGLAPASPAFAAPVPSGALREAIAAAPPGAVIEVRGGWHAGPLVLRRPVTLRGIGRPVIDGRGLGDVVVIAAPDVRLEGFLIRGSALAYSREAAGIVVRGARAVIRDNRVEDTLFGIYLAEAQDALVEGNTVATADLAVERRGHAVYLWRARGVRLRDNRLTRGKDGFYIAFSDDNVVERNAVSNTRYGVHYMYAHRNVFRGNRFTGNLVGAAIMYSTDVVLEGNVFEGSRAVVGGAGLIFKDADRLLVRGNRIVHNRVGVEFDTTPASIGGWARLEDNLIAFNEVGIGLMSTAAITATGNAIVENLRAVAARGAVRSDANRWAAGGRGNYWGDYAGFDAAGDGIGDVPYRRTDLLEWLADAAPPLQLFLFTPAHLALETASRLVPLVTAPPLVEDPAPLAALPPLPAPAPAGAPRPGRGGSLLWISLGLLMPAAAAVVAVRPRRRT